MSIRTIWTQTWGSQDVNWLLSVGYKELTIIATASIVWHSALRKLLNINSANVKYCIFISSLLPSKLRSAVPEDAWVFKSGSDLALPDGSKKHTPLTKTYRWACASEFRRVTYKPGESIWCALDQCSFTINDMYLSLNPSVIISSCQLSARNEISQRDRFVALTGSFVHGFVGKIKIK